jgi:hypothetical protein
LHAQVVAAIERTYRDRWAEHVEELAHHAVRGGLDEKAVGYLRQAGLRAMARAAYPRPSSTWSRRSRPSAASPRPGRRPS